MVIYVKVPVSCYDAALLELDCVHGIPVGISEVYL